MRVVSSASMTGLRHRPTSRSRAGSVKVEGVSGSQREGSP